MYFAESDEATRHDWIFHFMYRIVYLWAPANTKTMGYETMFDEAAKTTKDLINTDHRAMICRVTLPEMKAFKKVAWVPKPE